MVWGSTVSLGAAAVARKRPKERRWQPTSHSLTLPDLDQNDQISPVEPSDWSSFSDRYRGATLESLLLRCLRQPPLIKQLDGSDDTAERIGGIIKN